MSTAANYLLTRSLENVFLLLFTGILTADVICYSQTVSFKNLTTCDLFYAISYNTTNPCQNPALVFNCHKSSTNSNARSNEHQMYTFKGLPLKIYAPDHVKKQTDYIGAHCVARVFATKSHAAEADIVLLRSTSHPRRVTGVNRKSNQIWVMQFLESPLNTPELSFFDQKINYTAGYRSDVDIVTRYGRYQLASKVVNIDKSPQNRKNSVLWIVSNCWTSNARKQLAEELSRFYKVDVYGQCSTGKQTQKFVDELFSTGNYKYYLSLENSNCREYITEKVFENAFKNGLIPIVYGATRKDYENLLPPSSFIFAQDYSSPQDLANHLTQIDADKNLFDAFFTWKTTYEFFDQNIFDRLCSVFYNAPSKTYHKLSLWWNKLDSCEIVKATGIWKKT